ncbi:MAG: dTMP kinase [Gammaproteobacteria bacterium]
MTQGRFITIEGVEGVGKSTNIALVKSLLEARGYEVLLTREPGGTPTGERIREILLDKDEQAMTAMTELLLVFAARSQHVSQVIMPALAAGQWVISDRFTDSSYAYQGGGRELGIEIVAALEAQVLADFRPDLTIVLDVDIATGLERATREAEADRFESEQASFFQRVRETFLTLAEADRYRVIDAGQPIEKVQVDLTEVIVEFIGSH